MSDKYTKTEKEERRKTALNFFRARMKMKPIVEKTTKEKVKARETKIKMEKYRRKKTQEILDKINKKLKTNYKMED